MRLKIILSAFLLGGAAITLAAWWADSSVPRSAPTSAAVSESKPASQPAQPRTAAADTTFFHPPSPCPPDSDPAAGILADLQSPILSIRKSALQQARDLDDRSLIPQLETLAARTDDSGEKSDILDTINFLKLPSIVEDVAAAQAARAAAGQPEPARSLINRWTGQPLARRD